MRSTLGLERGSVRGREMAYSMTFCTSSRVLEHGWHGGVKPSSVCASTASGSGSVTAWCRALFILKQICGQGEGAKREGPSLSRYDKLKVQNTIKRAEWLFFECYFRPLFEQL